MEVRESFKLYRFVTDGHWHRPEKYEGVKSKQIVGEASNPFSKPDVMFSHMEGQTLRNTNV